MNEKGRSIPFLSRSSELGNNDVFIQKILQYADSRRIAE